MYLNYFYQKEKAAADFLKEKYPGAKQSPTNIITSMSSANGNPDEILQGIKALTLINLK